MPYFTLLNAMQGRFPVYRLCAVFSCWVTEIIRPVSALEDASAWEVDREDCLRVGELYPGKPVCSRQSIKKALWTELDTNVS